MSATPLPGAQPPSVEPSSPEVDWQRVFTMVLCGVIIAIGCTIAGFWQFDRHQSRDARNQAILSWASSAPSELSAAFSSPAAQMRDDDLWRKITFEAQYLPDATLLLRNRPVNKVPAVHVISPAELADGSVVLVDRGWLPAAVADDPDLVPPTPTGTVKITGHLLPADPADDRQAPLGQLQSANPQQVSTALAALGIKVAPELIYQTRFILRIEDPAPAAAPTPIPDIETTQGSHLSYSFQWWSLALGALIGFGVLARRELHSEEQELAEASSRKKRRSPSEDELYEDQLVDRMSTGA